ncbi:flagellar motor protein MotB [Desulfosporosinus sp. BICA1-9]|uniref:flagellar motor protein MotB n=1 Tax=Desulfosporosinus sp. BICA1-9 TaxID=1531958 RepID=UPI00054B5623|nr:flagellar motor protein MotB [Desulfosporosinus sp. BICA1-9]KJS49613.1 MAG: flagellar motor protein MotB [Peptococcaceae bacterium BRH_c23]KJS77895.1 MAG: flagellar motor protein MotB [Desulfosporosinus sp. BICA1-9]HBW39198.1 flagellar motor protein MotB [Desulfosporosinus sp.]
MKKHKKEHHEEHIDETWLIPYADLLTLLLALFIILFASSQVDEKKYAQVMQGLSSAFNGGVSVFEQSNTISIDDVSANDLKKLEENNQDQNQELKDLINKEKQDMEAIKKKLDVYIMENGLTLQLQTYVNNDMLKITIQDYALFDSGRAVVKPEAQKLAAVISEMLSMYPGYKVEVAGHTDNIPIKNYEFESNWDLSSRRSLNFMKYLLQSNSIDQARFRSIGYGEYQPIDTNETAEGRAKNRRVDVNIIRNTLEAKPLIP